MSDLEDMLSGILGDPKQMEKISSVARSLMGGDDGDGALSVDADALNRIKGMMGKTGGRDENLLLAMRPYLSDKRRSKMDRAMKIAKLAAIASLATDGIGGDGDV